MKWHCLDKEFDCETPIVVGVLNITPDSFSDAGECLTLDKALQKAREMRVNGADIIELGAESTRPGAQEISVAVELARLVPVLDVLLEEGFVVSIDTRHAQVAHLCLDMGAHIINDISGFTNRKMQNVISQSHCGIVLMHMQGNPHTMQDAPYYVDVVEEVFYFLSKQVSCLQSLGIKKERICIDPGIGFGKTFEDNKKLIESFSSFKKLDFPLMIAVSRKSYIGQVADLDNPKTRDAISSLAAYALNQEVSGMIRTHNPKNLSDVFDNAKRVYIALGSNMGDSIKTLQKAIEDISHISQTYVHKCSKIYESEPAYKEDQASFTNAVIEIYTMLDPYKLLEELHAIENKHGRVRKEANGPRTLDLDIIDYEGHVCNDSVLSLPHPLALERDFVVTPLLEINNDLVLANDIKVTKDNISYGRITSILL